MSIPHLHQGFNSYYDKKNCGRNSLVNVKVTKGKRNTKTKPQIHQNSPIKKIGRGSVIIN